MLQANTIRSLWESSFLTSQYEEGFDQTNTFALPEPALKFLVELCNRLNVKTVFEFGSGASTTALLNHGCEVTSLEDSDHWMNQTRSRIPAQLLGRHSALVKPLTVNWVGAIPVMSWEPKQISRHLGCDLVLVDSPSSPPFREAALWSALTHPGNPRIVVVDDLNIPGVARFCHKIAAANPSLLFQNVQVGHRFGVFAKLTEDKLVFRHSPMETIKGLRRFILMRRHHLTTYPAA